MKGFVFDDNVQGQQQTFVLHVRIVTKLIMTYGLLILIENKFSALPVPIFN